MGHALFWIVSFNWWSLILRSGEGPISLIEGFGVEGFGVEMGLFYLFIFFEYLFCFAPFIWLFRRIRLWIKIAVTLIFAALVLFMLYLFFVLKDEDYKEIFIEFFIRNFLYVVVFHATIVFAVYYHLKVLIIRYLNRSRFGIYLISAVVLCLGSAVLNFAIFDFFLDKLFPSLFYLSYFKIWELVLIMSGYMAFTGILFLIGQYAQMLIEKREAAQNELAALKAQINPHFLFNNLNTIYSMASQNDRRTTDVILKLSDFLRYVLYDTSAERIPLAKEVEIIKIYVDLQKERASPDVTQIELITEGKFKGATITPLLLLPLAENCFKHGKGKDPGVIRIQIGFDGKELHFHTSNPIIKHEKIKEEKTRGIGISNVEKRLELIYPDNYFLKYENVEGVFSLDLRIKL